MLEMGEEDKRHFCKRKRRLAKEKCVYVQKFRKECGRALCLNCILYILSNLTMYMCLVRAVE